jgi:hypothetical protein
MHTRSKAQYVMPEPVSAAAGLATGELVEGWHGLYNICSLGSVEELIMWRGVTSSSIAHVSNV